MKKQTKVKFNWKQKTVKVYNTKGELLREFPKTREKKSK